MSSKVAPADMVEKGESPRFKAGTSNIVMLKLEARISAMQKENFSEREMADALSNESGQKIT